MRFLYDALVLVPLCYLFKRISATHSLNYLLATGILLVGELILVLSYGKLLCRVRPREIFERIRGIEIKQVDPFGNMSMNVKIRETALSLRYYASPVKSKNKN